MIMTLIRNLIPGVVWKWLAAAGAALVGILGVYTKARLDQKKADKLKDAKANVKTIEDVLREGPSDDPTDVIRDRMRQRARKP